MKNKYMLLKDVVSVCTGYPFRKKIEPVHKGINVIQMKDVDQREGLDTTNLISTELPYRAPSDWVENNDVIFLAKGSKHFAVLVEGLEHKAVCTPHFFYLKNKSGKVRSDFIVWLLNQAPMMSYYNDVSEGSASKLIKKSSIENIKFILPEIEVQEEILAFDKLVHRQEKLMQSIHVKQLDKLNTLANQLLETKS